MSQRSIARRALESFLAVAVLACGVTQGWTQTQDDFFNDNALQEVRLTISSRDWQTLKATFDENTYYPADVTWKGVTVRNVGIRSRGSGTRNGVKPGLRIDVNRYMSNQEFLGLKAFDLKNMYTDVSVVRESVAMKLFARIGIPAPREAHTRLYVNNEYAGLYVIVESVDRTFVSRAFGAREAEVETGGYLFKYNYVFPWGLEYLGSDLRAYAALFEPKTRDTDAIVNLYGPIEAMVRAINESTDQGFASAVGAYLDLALFMKYLAIETFTVEWDGFTGNWATNNFYLYRFSQTNRSQLIPWDRDHAFTFVDIPITFRLDTNVLAWRAMAVPELRQMYLDTLMRCVTMAEEPGLDDPRGWLEREVDRQARQIAAAFAEDPVVPFSVDDFQADVAFLVQFARVRPPFVGCQVAQMADAVGEERDCSAALQAAGFGRQ